MQRSDSKDTEQLCALAAGRGAAELSAGVRGRMSRLTALEAAELGALDWGLSSQRSGVRALRRSKACSGSGTDYRPY